MAWLPVKFADTSDENNTYLVADPDFTRFAVAYWDNDMRDWCAADTADEYGAPARVDFPVYWQMYSGRMKEIIDDYEERKNV